MTDPDNTASRKQSRFVDFLRAIRGNDIVFVTASLATHPHWAQISNEPDLLPALHEAVRWNRDKIAAALLDGGADIHARDRAGRTALHVTPIGRGAETVRLMLSRGADVHARDRSGATPLSFAGGHEIAEVLIAAGAVAHEKSFDAQPGWTDRPWRTPLHGAVSNDDVELLEYLIAKGCDINARNADDETPLHLASTRGLHRIVAALLKHGAVADTRSYTTSPLESAAAADHAHVIELLLEHAEGDLGTHLAGAMHAAGSGRAIRVLSVLLARGVDINMQDRQGQTALHGAAIGSGRFGRDGQNFVVGWLLDRGADPNRRDRHGYTPLHGAILRQSTTVELLRCRGAEADAFALAGLGEVDALGALIEGPPGVVNTPDGLGRTLLHWAATTGKTPVAAMLLARGADAGTPASDCSTPLHMAALHGHALVAKALISHGADVNIRVGRKPPPLMSAICGSCDPEMVVMLLEAGASTGMTENPWGSPLHAAVGLFSAREVVEALLRFGAAVNEKNRRGQTPLDIAISPTPAGRERNPLAASILRRHGAKPAAELP